MRRTDLIYEAAEFKETGRKCSVHSGERYGTEYSEVIVSEPTDGISAGRYVTLFTEKGNVRVSF